jgi:glycosyltransferase involved in cell wall biosynthesis
MTREAQRIKRLKKRIGNLLFFNRMVCHAAALHCLTEKEAEDARAWKRPTFVVGNGTILPLISELAQVGRKNKLRFVFIGRLDLYTKGLDLLLDACVVIQQELRESGVEVCLFGPDVNGSRDLIREVIAHNQMADVVHLEEPVLDEEKVKTLQSADLFIHTSRFEGHPTAVLDALSYGVPCLLTPGTNMSSEVIQFGAGWEVDPNPEAIAAGLQRALALRTGLAAKGRCARTLAETRYSWDHIAQQVLAEYRKILDRTVHACSSD